MILFIYNKQTHTTYSYAYSIFIKILRIERKREKREKSTEIGMAIWHWYWLLLSFQFEIVHFTHFFSYFFFFCIPFRQPFHSYWILCALIVKWNQQFTNVHKVNYPNRIWYWFHFCFLFCCWNFFFIFSLYRIDGEKIRDFMPFKKLKSFVELPTPLGNGKSYIKKRKEWKKHLNLF